MVLFDQIVEVFHLPQFHVRRQHSSCFQVGNGLGICRVFIDIDHTRSQYRGIGNRGNSSATLQIKKSLPSHLHSCNTTRASSSRTDLSASAASGSATSPAAFSFVLTPP